MKSPISLKLIFIISVVNHLFVAGLIAQPTDIACNSNHFAASKFPANLVTIGQLSDNRILMITYDDANHSFVVYEFPSQSLSSANSFDLKELKSVSMKERFPAMYSVLSEDRGITFEAYESNYLHLPHLFGWVTFVDKAGRSFVMYGEGEFSHYSVDSQIVNTCSYRVVDIKQSFNIDRSLYQLQYLVPPSQIVHVAPLYNQLSSNEPNVMYRTVLLGPTFDYAIGRFEIDPNGGAHKRVIRQTRPFVRLCLNVANGHVWFSPKPCTKRETVPTELTKGFVRDGKFYLFGSKSVFIFEETTYDTVGVMCKLTVVDYEQWFECSEPNWFTDVFHKILLAIVLVLLLFGFWFFLRMCLFVDK